MNKNEIIDSIRILNESLNSDFLKINDIKIDTNILRKIIREKKAKKEIYEENYKSSSTPAKQSESSSYTSSSIIDDSIAVTNFTIPSSLYKSSNTQSNAQTTISNL